MWFKKKHKVPVTIHSNKIIDKMMKTYDLDFWRYVSKLGVKREYNYREGINYLVFDNEEDYLLFVLKL